MLRTSRSRLLLVVSVVAALVVGGVVALVVATGGDDPEAQPQRFQYVALGDSYTSAPLVPPQTPDDPCLGSEANYPHLLAEELPSLELTDVSCGAATTVNMLEPQSLPGATLPPQFDALSEDTDLVTVGIGGNDFGLFGRLVYACFPAVQEGQTCHDQSPRGVELITGMNLIQANIEGVIEGIVERAPEARVVVVTYPRLLPASGACADQAPFGVTDAAYISDVNRRLSEALVGAAEETGVEYVDVFGPSAGHDVCSEDPWVNGYVTDEARASSFHPFAEGQAAVAGLVREHLCDEGFAC